MKHDRHAVRRALQIDLHGEPLAIAASTAEALFSTMP